MTRKGWVLLGLIFLVASLPSCTKFPFRPVQPGEVRLVRIDVPETLQEDQTYEAIVSIRASETPVVKQACFRWVSRVPSVANSSMYWYNYEASSNEPIGSARSRWLAEGPYYDFSAPVCVEDDGIVLIAPDRLAVRFKVKGLKPGFNGMECYIEYVSEGRLRESNRVSARINTSQSQEGLP